MDDKPIICILVFSKLADYQVMPCGITPRSMRLTKSTNAKGAVEVVDLDGRGRG